jgi:hypothetical protein
MGHGEPAEGERGGPAPEPATEARSGAQPMLPGLR